METLSHLFVFLFPLFIHSCTEKVEVLVPVPHVKAYHAFKCLVIYQQRGPYLQKLCLFEFILTISSAECH